MRQLTNVNVTHVSYVDKAANKKKFFMTKSAEKLTPVFEKQVKVVTKAKDPQQLVYGVVYEPEIEDIHGDYMTAEDIEKAAHGFMSDYQNVDKQHDFTTNAGTVVESYVAPVDMEIGDETIIKGTWVLVTKATDEIWEDIQKGEFTGYSLAGTAEVEDVAKATTDNFNRRKTFRDINASVDAFQVAVWSILDNYTTNDNEKLLGIQSEIQELSDLISTIQPIVKSKEPTTKSEKQGFAQTIGSVVKSIFTPKNKEDEEVMTEEQLAKALGSALQPFADRLEQLEKATKPADPKKREEELEENNTKKKKDTKKSDDSLNVEAITKAVQAAVAPLNAKIEQLEKSRISNVTEPNYQTETVEKSSPVPSYIDEMFPMSE